MKITEIQKLLIILCRVVLDTCKNTWKRHQDTVFWIDIDLGIIKEGLKFYQTRSNAIILQGVFPPSCIVRAERLKGGEPLYKRQYLSPRPPPKISLRHDLNWTRGNDDLGSTVEHRPVGKLVQQSLGETVHFGSSKPTQSPKTNEDRSGKPVAQEIVGVLQEEPSSSDRPGRPVSREEQHVRNHDGSGKPEREEVQHTVQENYHLKNRDNVDKFDLATDDANVDFSVSGIPEEAVKRSENFNILQLIRRITRHPQKQAVQNDLDKEQSFNAFSAESKKAIKESGNIEISEIINAEPKWQCKSCLNHCNPGVIYCVCGRLMTTDSAENRKYTPTGNLSSCFFVLGGLISICSYSFWRGSNYFLSSWRVTVFDPGGINIFLFMQFFPAVRFVMSTLFLLSREHSTIVEGQALGTVHIMEDRVPDYVYRRTHTCTHAYTCTCVSLFFFCCVVPLVVGWGWVGWSGVCRGGVCGVVWVARRSLNK